MAADPTEGVRNHALSTLCGRDADARIWARAQGIPFDDVPDYAAPASLEDLRRVMRLGSTALGSHSWSHPNLTLLHGSDLEDELRRPLDWLRAHFGTALPWLAYPYGLSSERVERALVACGYHAAVGQHEGWMRSATNRPFQIPRFNIPAGMSMRGFAARLSGLWP
jgi:peptidoglycan/xylan/chitin deacetylase (PgdA/CDA1 family)